MVANASGHSRGYAQGLVYSAEVVEHEVERQHVLVVLDFLR
ncbi:MAG: hypothetical protein QOH31_3584, partial [Verrucomicrobiota bacterium]